MKKSSVFAKWLNKEYDCYLKHNEMWNGFLVPYFTFDVVNHMLTDLNNSLSYDENLDVFIYKQDGYDDEIFESVTHHINGENIKLYSIGGYSWCWC